ncbi:hypothetical protein F5Y16DRAFT_371073 [Xylariaceae sp. FL0255]|nr:hypothetical protein F5Y16DRAFT_371073 [Xylariaceae sp. FL0255]
MCETSPLYSIPILEYTAGKTCGLVFRAAGSSDSVQGTGGLDIFKIDFTDLATLDSRNLRDSELARTTFDANTKLYDFDTADVTPLNQSFPCPAGKTLAWEAAALGEFGVDVVAQDFAWDGASVPNGLSVALW